MTDEEKRKIIRKAREEDGKEDTEKTEEEEYKTEKTTEELKGKK